MNAPRDADAPIAGIDLGGTNLQVGIVDVHGAMTGRVGLKSEADRGLDHVLGRVEEGVRRAAEEAGATLDDLAAVGIAAAGAIDAARGIVLDAPNLRWRDVPLRALLEERLGRPVVVENDVNGAAWGEYRLGAGAGRGDLLAVWVGTGVGGGLVLDGRLHHGTRATAGEIGHTVVEPDEAPGRRTIEDHCSRTGMRRLIAHGLGAHPGSIVAALVDGDVERIGTRTLNEAYVRGDALVSEVIDRAAERLGVAIANCVTTLALDTVVVGGGITEALGPEYVARIADAFRANVFPERCRSCLITMTALTADAGLLGAALLARAHADARLQPQSRQ